MTRTGYSAMRAQPHEEFVHNTLIPRLRRLGYRPQALPPDGDGPDIRIERLAGPCVIDAKTHQPNNRNISIKCGAIDTALKFCSEGMPFYFISQEPADSLRLEVEELAGARPPEVRASVHSAYSLLQHLHGGPRAPTRNGSRTDWYLFVDPIGTPFDEFFPVIG